MKLGPLALENNLVLAPMQSVTSGPFRRFCRLFQKIGLVSVPMLYTKRLMTTPKSINFELHGIEDERPISVQLIGNDSESLRKAIDYLDSYRFDVLDINAGCPSRRVIHAEQGGCLLKNLNKLEELLNTAVKYCSRPVSLKTRLGFNDSRSDIVDLAKIINDSGIAFATIHARTVKSKFEDSSLDIDALKALREKVSIPLVGNGDIVNGKIAKKFIDHANVDALMIGRESMGNPEIFNQVGEYLTSGMEVTFENNKMVMEKRIILYKKALKQFLDCVELPYPRQKFEFTELKRNSIWFTKNLRNSTHIRTSISKTRNLNALEIVLEKYFKN